MRLNLKIIHIVVLFLLTIHINAQNTFTNPIIPGFHPDPSICRVNDDYYLVTSSFEWFPGLPVFHSKDLVNWEQIGHVLTRPSQLQLKDGLAPSQGLWAPTIRYHNGLYYVICTAAGAGGNFFVTSEKPEGPYSEPVFIKDAPGIDPSLFFEDDGSVWYSGSINDEDVNDPDRWLHEDKIYLQQIDIRTGDLMGERYFLTSGYATNSPFAEAPHIYKINGKYYLVIAEGGTWEEHAVTVFTSDKLTGTYIPSISNPVLTHRHLGKKTDITTIGHADLVQTQYGDWYAVVLGVRPLEGYNMLGRETFLTSVEFQGGIPVFNPGKGRVLAEDRFPNLTPAPVKKVPDRDKFDGNRLNYCWSFLRTPYENWYLLNNGLTIKLRPQTSMQFANPSLIARRIQHHNFSSMLSMTFSPKKENEEAGLIVIQNDRFQYRLVLTRKGKDTVIRAVEVKDGKQTVLAEKKYQGKNIIMRMEGNGLKCSFSFGNSEENLTPLISGLDATLYSTNVAGGFIGPFVGMYAGSNGLKSANEAQFEWFEYKPR